MGFAGIYGEQREVRIAVQIKNADRELDGDVPVCLVADRQEVRIGKIELDAGCGSFERRFDLEGERMRIGAHSLGAEDIAALRIAAGRDLMIEGRLRNPETEKRKEAAPETAAAEDRPEEKKAPELEALQKQNEPFIPCEKSYPGNKWDQLKSQYKKVHPFGDEREFISIELKDFVVLGERYQRLINNSFLLHGFYNYRHLILGRDRRIGTDRETCFYLGVPGVFFEREKMVAIMFGFEGFECAGPVEIGTFGYYLRSVEL